MHRLVTSCAAMLALLGAAAANADCIYPQVPTAIPDGATASYEDMVAAHQAVKDFDADIRTYNTCMELDVKSRLEDGNLDEGSRATLVNQLAERNDAAVDHAEFVVSQFNEQLRIYRARAQQQ
jgi:hypothetical protein